MNTRWEKGGHKTNENGMKKRDGKIDSEQQKKREENDEEKIWKKLKENLKWTQDASKMSGRKKSGRWRASFRAARYQKSESQKRDIILRSKR